MTAASAEDAGFDAPEDPVSELPPESYAARIRRRFRRSLIGMVGAAMVTGILIASVFAPLLAPYDPTSRDTANQNSPPQALRFADGFYSHPLKVELDAVTFQPVFAADEERRCPLGFLAPGWTYGFLGISLERHLLAPEAGCPVHLLGTDGQGRDMLSRILVGSRLTLLMAGLVVAISVSIGTTVGLISGFLGGRIDHWLQRGTELFLTLPELPLYLALVAIIPRNTDPVLVFFLLAGILSLLRWASLAREVRGKTLALQGVDYVRAAEAVGAGTARIVFRHILPNVLSHVVVVITLMVPSIVLVESFLSFGFNMLGDGLRDAIDPYE